MEYLVGFDELNQIACYMHINPDNPDQVKLRYYQRNVTPLIEANKRTQIYQREHKPTNGIEMAASIPMNYFMDWQAQGILDDKKYLNNLLNDEFSAFKTTERKL